MLNEKDVTIISVCDELSKHKETSHLVEKVADDLFKPAENVTTEKLYAEYNNILSYIEYKKNGWIATALNLIWQMPKLFMKIQKKPLIWLLKST